MKKSNVIFWMRRCRLAVTMIAIACFVLLPAINASAEIMTSVSGAAITECRTADDGTVYFYIKGVEDLQSGSTVQIATTACENNEKGVFDGSMPIRTILILDNSNSLSLQLGKDDPKALMNAIIDNHVIGEQFKIVTVSDTFTELASYSADYDGLKSIVDGISYENQDTYLTDCLYTYLTEESSGQYFTRIILITDGADDKEITYTQSELTSLMQSANVVVHTVGASGGNDKELERLFSYSRITRGTGISVNKNFDIDEVVSVLSEDYSIFCIRTTPPAELMDGSVKRARLSLNTGAGVVQLECDAKMGFAVAQATPEEPAEEPQPEEKPEVVEDKPQIPVINTGNDSDKEDVPEEGEKNILPIIIIIIAVVVVAVVITVIIILLKNKKKKKQAQANAEVNIIPETPVQDIGKTEVLIQPSKQGSNTQLLWGNEDERKSSSRIILTDKNDPSKVFSAAISGSVSIGRVDSNDIVLSHDSAVSGHHLEIIKKGNLYYVNDLGSSNGTYLNGTKIHTETAVMTGEVLEIGHTKYTVTIED